MSKGKLRNGFCEATYICLATLCADPGTEDPHSGAQGTDATECADVRGACDDTDAVLAVVGAALRLVPVIAQLGNSLVQQRSVCELLQLQLLHEARLEVNNNVWRKITKPLTLEEGLEVLHSMKAPL